MNQSVNKIFLLFFLISILICGQSFAQEKVYVLSKISNQKKVRKIYNKPYFKVKTIDGVKRKTKFTTLAENYFVTSENDTIVLNEIVWIKAKRQLTKTKGILALTASVVGTIYTGPAIIAALYFMAHGSSAWIFLAPATAISVTIIGYKNLGKRKYRLKNWEISAQNQIN